MPELELEEKTKLPLFVEAYLKWLDSVFVCVWRGENILDGSDESSYKEAF